MEQVKHAKGIRVETFLQVILLLIFPLVLFLPALSYPFLEWDDRVYVIDNIWLYNLSFENIIGVFKTPYFSNYHPLTILSYMIDFQFWGHNPVGYRAVNILFHLATALTAYILLRSLEVRSWIAFFLLLIFAVHPLRIESVVWISERKDVLCAFFYILATLLWVKGSQESGRVSLCLSLASISYLLALSAKSMAVSFPLVIMLYDLLMNRSQFKSRVPIYLTLLIIAALFAWLNIHAQSAALNEGESLSSRIGVAAFSPFFYLWKSIVPIDLSPLYPNQFQPTNNPVVYILALLGIVLVLGFTGCLWKRAPLITWSLLSTGIIMGPVSGIVSFGSAFAGDRYSYIPTLFLFIGAGIFLTGLHSKYGRTFTRGFIPIAVLLTITYSAVTYSLLPIWESDLALWKRVMAVYPESERAKVYAGYVSESNEPAENNPVVQKAQVGYTPAMEHQISELIKAGDLSEAQELTEKISISYTRYYWNMRIAMAQENWQEALVHAELLLKSEGIPPRLMNYRGMAAWILVRNGKESEAIEELESQVTPSRGAFSAWAELAERSESTDKKISFAKEALAIHPGHVIAVRVLYETLSKDNRLESGEPLFRKARKHHLADVQTKRLATAALGRIYEKRGNVEKAQRFYEDAFALEQVDESSLSPELLNYLGFRAEKLEQYSYAYTLYQKALELDPEFLNAGLNLAYLEMLRGELKAAEEILLKLKEIHPDDETLSANLTRIQSELAEKE